MAVGVAAGVFLQVDTSNRKRRFGRRSELTGRNGIRGSSRRRRNCQEAKLARAFTVEV